MTESSRQPKAPAGRGVTRAAKKLGAALGSTLVCLLVLEVAFRVAGYRPLYDSYSKPELFWRYDALLGWAHEPSQRDVYVGPRPFPVEFRGQVSINSLGLRGPELPPRPDKGLRVMVLGDSVVAGFEVNDDQTFVARLQESLTHAVGSPVQTINAGVRGYGTDQALLYFREHGRKLEPDLVVFQAANNDAEDNTTLHRARRPFSKPAFALRPNGSLELQGSPVPEYPLCSGVRLDASFTPIRIDTAKSRAMCWLQMNLADHSALFTFATMRIQQNPQLVYKLFNLGTPTDQAVDMATRGGRTSGTPAQRLTVALVRELAKTVLASGSRFVLSIARSDLQYLDVTQLDADGIERFDSSQVDEQGTGDHLSKYDPSMHFQRDSHLNAKGHARMAELLTPFLATRLSQIQASREGRAIPEHAQK